ncbi:uncharacterized protein LOC122849127 isoform X2 [Aphidius gifuensis]|uniref:uncharacterized protein LOC122849127 isoform X2 n=1 Tax=Aphidius gifuensis TaxID=684658 RepID=UPI001CDBAC6C|nr:uncharacterized protein LOC122849127 isoform X2 [Aphidius gifuensis]
MTTGSSSGYYGILRARRRDFSQKLNSKSSREMIYENEELRLKTMYINAEVEQGQNDIKKLRRENRQLKREIWFLREEYKKLEDILESERIQKTEVFGEKLSSPTCFPNYSVDSDKRLEQLLELPYVSQRQIENGKDQSHDLFYGNTLNTYLHDCSSSRLMIPKPLFNESGIADEDYEDFSMKTSEAGSTPVCDINESQDEYSIDENLNENYVPSKKR